MSTYAHRDLYFTETTAKFWLVEFRTGDSNWVVVRGLRFFDGDDNEIAPPVAYPMVFTDYGETYSSSVMNVRESVDIDPYTHSYDSSTMWHSKKVGANNWASLVYEFPEAKTYDSIAVHTQHSGLYHKSERAQIEYKDEDGFHYVTQQATSSPDTTLNFTSTTSKVWKIAFKAGSSGWIVVRGLEFD
jgi:hypothetical protein